MLRFSLYSDEIMSSEVTMAREREDPSPVKKYKLINEDHCSHGPHSSFNSIQFEEHLLGTFIAKQFA